MGRYATQRHLVKKEQVFSASGVFTPSDALLALGGAVTVRCVGGGGGGQNGNGGGGGSGADITRIIRVTGPVEVIVGAGGNAGPADGAAMASRGGSTSFGAFLTAGGGYGAPQTRTSGTGNPGGASGGPGGFCGGSASAGNGGSGSYPEAGLGGGAGGLGGVTGSTNARAATPPAPTSGGGGGGAIQSVGLATAGASGVCIVSWEE